MADIQIFFPFFLALIHTSHANKHPGAGDTGLTFLIGEFGRTEKNKILPTRTRSKMMLTQACQISR
jgi:hypothetical protein